MTKKCAHEIEQKADYPDDYICRKCQTIWTYEKGGTSVEMMTFPLQVRRLILEKQAKKCEAGWSQVVEDTL